MISALLLVAAAAAVYWPQLLELAARVSLPTLTRRHIVAALFAAVGLLSLTPGPQGDAPTPMPLPTDGLVLRGTFVGPTASSDAATVGALCEELAAEVEWDGMQPDPLFKSGVAVDDLRRRSRELRCRGESIGNRQPAARDAIAAYMTRTLGSDGGPLTPSSRAAWISTLREVGRAATDAAH